ncbi:flavodoxin family protein [Caloramator sp. E03]|uniref:flavodoxin family protein n=1 Tax=Caloramator sp. E03 TaxID=2576307 RepID=UPI001110F356|nr:flavodoxin family protein [Caloramator sp. E03]QCX33190.1 flavodoxin family protein [Caloramator sp. E03]
MKVVAFNGSPKENGNTYYAIKTVADELYKEGIEVEIIHVGNKAIRGCIACGACSKNNGKCIIDDEVNGWVDKMINADGIILGSPVYFSGINGTMKSFLDRAFYMAGRKLRYKVGASVVAVRRSGGVSAFNQLNNYINYAQMLMPSSNYWNVIHGRAIGEASQDEEGNQIMRVLGKNMAYLLKLRENGKNVVKEPEMENKIYTNFIR